MFGIHDFGLFLAAGILLNLTPGPDTAYILGRSVAQGRESGILEKGAAVDHPALTLP
jgi:threonine/homoserine/homoserine lactone efflux protein